MDNNEQSLSVCVLTPSIGKETLSKAIKSVDQQTYRNRRHLIVADGFSVWDRILSIVGANKGKETKIDASLLYDNVGANGFYGHRVYASFPHLINDDLIFFLDEDNWYEHNHIAEAVKIFNIDPGINFVYSLRNIISSDGKHSLEDNCEALGKYPAWVTDIQPPGTPQTFLVDTSTYAFRTSFLINVCQLWHFGWGGDRRFFQAMMSVPEIKFTCTGEYTLNYRLDGNPGSVNLDFFKQGNLAMSKKYGWNTPLPWAKNRKGADLVAPKA